MFKSSVPSTFIALLLCSLAFSAQATSRLNGMASHQELGSEQFIGALYLERTSDSAQEVLDIDGAKRMELRIVAEGGIPARRFSRMWIEGVAINNSGSVLNTQADNMVLFSNMVRGRLRPNDIMSITLNPGDGVDVDLNGVNLGTIEDEAFFNVLLRSWVGNVPLSSTFRRNLLQPNDIDDDLRRRYQAVEPSDRRIATIEQWGRPEEPEPEPEPEEASSQTAERPSLDTSTPLVTALDMPNASLDEQEAEPEPEPEPEPQPEPEPEPEPEPAVAEEDEEEDNEPMLTAESLRAQQVYFSDLMRSVLQNTSYPRRALQRNQEGEIRVAVVIERNGEVQSLEVLEESEYTLLNREAERAIKAAAPFPDVPEVIQGDVYEFSVPFTFVLPD